MCCYRFLFAFLFVRVVVVVSWFCLFVCLLPFDHVTSLVPLITGKRITEHSNDITCYIYGAVVCTNSVVFEACVCFAIGTSASAFLMINMDVALHLSFFHMLVDDRFHSTSFTIVAL